MHRPKSGVTLLAIAIALVAAAIVTLRSRSASRPDIASATPANAHDAESDPGATTPGVVLATETFSTAGAANPPSASRPADERRTTSATIDSATPTPSAAPSPVQLPLLLQGSLRWHPSTDRDDFEVRYRKPTEDRTTAIYLAPDGTFKLFGMRAPGVIDVLVSMRDDPIPLTTVLGVSTVDDIVSTDTRLQSIDVTQVRAVTATLVDIELRTNDQPASLTTLDPDLDPVHVFHGARPDHHVRDVGTRDVDIEVLLRFPRQPVRASAPGCIDQVLELDPTNPRIVLQRALRVRVEVPTGPAVLDPHFPPLPHLETIDDERASNANSNALDPESEPERRTADRERSPPHVSLLYSSRNVTRSGSRDSTFAVSAPGRYRASWRMFGNAKLRAGAVEFVIDAIDGPELTIQTNFAPDDYATAVAACRATLEAARQRHNKQR